jgi:cold-inducible RNA-binding protein
MPVRLFVGNLSYEATEAELRQHFGTVGPVSYCYLPTDRDTGRPRGFAFVEFADDTLAQEAISRLNNQPFRGRPLAVKEAQPRESRPPGGGPPRPAFGSGPRPPGRPLAGGPMSAPADTGAPGARRPGNFGPDAPPKGKKGKFKGGEPRGPKGPIRVKPNGRIYSTDAYGEDEDASFEGDDFATRAEDDDPVGGEPVGEEPVGDEPVGDEPEES